MDRRYPVPPRHPPDGLDSPHRVHKTPPMTREILENEARKRPFHETFPLYINIGVSLAMLGLVIGYFILVSFFCAGLPMRTVTVGLSPRWNHNGQHRLAPQ